MDSATVNTEEWALRLNRDLIGARARISALEAQLCEGITYLRNLLDNFVKEHFPDNTKWRPLHDDLLGMLTQMDNASTIAREYKARIAALEAQLAERVKVKALSWSEHPALNRGRKLVAYDCFGNEFARLDLHENQTATSVLMFKAEHEQRYIRLIHSALEATPPAPKVTEEMIAAGLENYSEGGCMGLSEDERREVVISILTAAQEASR